MLLHGKDGRFSSIIDAIAENVRPSALVEKRIPFIDVDRRQLEIIRSQRLPRPERFRGNVAALVVFKAEAGKVTMVARANRESAET